MNETMPDLPLEEVHIWSARKPSVLPPDFEAVLSHEESDRARRFHFPKHRVAYTFAHAVLRDVLSRYLHCEPRDISFAEAAFGKPFVTKPTGLPGLEFNLSHSGDMVLVGVCHRRRVGIDVEEIRPIDDLLSIAEMYFTPDEFAFIHRQLPSDRERTFLHCWTRKEAYVKAVGKGLMIPLSSIETHVSNRATVVIPESIPRSPDEASWRTANLDLHEGYVAAIAIEEGATELVHVEWPNGIVSNMRISPVLKNN
jgi:4'-phosphopantetheinyl transferase